MNYIIKLPSVCVFPKSQHFLCVIEALLPLILRWCLGYNLRHMRILAVKSVILVTTAALAAVASASIEFQSGRLELRLSDANGAVESLVAPDGYERVVAATEAFTLQLLDANGEPTRLKSSNFAFSRAVSTVCADRANARSSSGGSLTWRHSSGLVVQMEITAADGEFRFKPSVEGIP